LPSSWDRGGGNADYVTVPSGERVVLGEAQGAGVVRHLWMTMTSLPRERDELRQTVLRMYWDGEASPSVEVPLGDFFGVGFGLRRNFVSLPLHGGKISGAARRSFRTESPPASSLRSMVCAAGPTWHRRTNENHRRPRPLVAVPAALRGKFVSFLCASEKGSPLSSPFGKLTLTRKLRPDTA
jgi:hypothetical protein